MPSHLNFSIDLDPHRGDFREGAVDVALPGHRPHSWPAGRPHDPLDCELRTVPLPRGFYARLLGLACELDGGEWRVASSK